MVGWLVLFLAFFVFVEPLLVLAHELGHATMALLAGHSATVFLGGSEEGKTASIGALSFVARPAGFLRPATAGFCFYDSDPSRPARIAIALTGPAVTIGLLVVVALVGSVESGALADVAGFAFIYLAIQAAFTLVPVRYPATFGPYGGYKSDGRVALELLLGWNPAPNEGIEPVRTDE